MKPLGCYGKQSLSVNMEAFKMKPSELLFYLSGYFAVVWYISTMYSFFMNYSGRYETLITIHAIAAIISILLGAVCEVLESYHKGD